MELNKRTKVGGGLLALALVALVCDRIIGNGPQPAAAASQADAAAPLAPREAPRTTAGATTPGHGALSARLKALATPEADVPTRDNVFLAPVAWFPPDEEVIQQKQVEAKKAIGEHHLTALLSSEKRGSIHGVIVDGKLLRVGVLVNAESADGKYTLELVRAWYDERRVAHAEVKVDGQLIELTVGNKDKDVRETDQSGGR